MFYRLNNKNDLEAMKPTITQAVYQEAKRIITILDESYNSKNQNGGYLYIGETKEDFKSICKLYPNLAIKDYEFMDNIWNENNQMQYVSLLYILSTDDSLSIIMPRTSVPKVIRDENHKRNKHEHMN